MGNINNSKFINVKPGNVIQIKDKKRGNMPYYTLSQVASLLNENECQIRYYVNIFDDILELEIVDKQFIFTDSDIDKLEFLIKLKNKGMTIKQITDYCDKLSLDTHETFVTESATSSIDDFVKILTQSQSEEFAKLEKQISEYIKLSIEKSINLLADKLIDNQNKQIKVLENTICNKINSKFDKQNELLNSKKEDTNLTTKHEDLIKEKNELLKTEMNDKIQLLSEELKNNYICINNNIISEIKKIKDIIYKAYYVENQIEKEHKHVSLLQRLFGIK